MLPSTTAEPTADPSPTPTSTPSTGFLQLSIRPWASVTIDCVDHGQTPRPRVSLPPGAHDVVLTHPDFQPYPRKVTIQAGATYVLQVDLRELGVRKR
jgi:hypothetical protein